jgi:phosphatidylglycerophosphate synthase
MSQAFRLVPDSKRWESLRSPLALHQRPVIIRPPGSREFVDAVLADLRESGYRPAAWGRLVATSCRRSLEQVARRPRAAVEVVTISSALVAFRGSRLRAAAGCLLAITHLGLLGEKQSLGLANALSLVRAALPARRWAAAVAIGTDLIDGLLARRAGPTAFGSYADPLADVAFWGEVAFRGGTGKLGRTAIVGLWAGPAAMIIAAYLVSGRSIDYPRPLLARRASAIAQVLLTLRLSRPTDPRSRAL